MSNHEFSTGPGAAHDTAGDPERPREEQTTPQRRSGWHPVNTGHLVMGVAFIGLVVVWALVTSDTVELADHGWVLGLPWLAGGAAGLVATVVRGARVQRDPRDQGSGTMHGWQ